MGKDSWDYPLGIGKRGGVENEKGAGAREYTYIYIYIYRVLKYRRSMRAVAKPILGELEGDEGGCQDERLTKIMKT